MSIFGNLHKDTASAAFVIPLHELARSLSLTSHSGRTAARIVDMTARFVCSRLILMGLCPIPREREAALDPPLRLRDATAFVYFDENAHL